MGKEAGVKSHKQRENEAISTQYILDSKPQRSKLWGGHETTMLLYWTTAAHNNKHIVQLELLTLLSKMEHYILFDTSLQLDIRIMPNVICCRLFVYCRYKTSDGHFNSIKSLSGCTGFVKTFFFYVHAWWINKTCSCCSPSYQTVISCLPCSLAKRIQREPHKQRRYQFKPAVCIYVIPEPEVPAQACSCWVTMATRAQTSKKAESKG